MGHRERSIAGYAQHGLLGSGGMARVYLASRAGTNQPVAIKRLHDHLAEDPELVAMFLDEARLAMRVVDPNVVRTIETISDRGHLALVMEYVHGATLATLRRDSEPLDPEVAVAIACDVLEGLHAAHEATDEHGAGLAIVHRDVSPHNIIVGVDGRARILDFGVAKALGRLRTTRDGALKGKLGFMPPEQLKGLDLDRRADIYSVSVVLWEALTGRVLFEAEDEAAMIEQALSAPIVAPSSICSSVPRELDAVLLRGLHRDRNARFGNAREMSVALATARSAAAATRVGAWVENTATAELANRGRLLAMVGKRSVRTRTAVTIGALTGAAAITVVALAEAHTRALPPPRCDVNAPFARPVWLGELNGFTARLSPDEHTVYFERIHKICPDPNATSCSCNTDGNCCDRDHGCLDGYSLYIATRTNVSAPFGAAAALSGLAVAPVTENASVDMSGLDLYFDATTAEIVPGRQHTLYVSTRANTTSPFSSAIKEPVIDGVEAAEAFVLPDASYLYFTKFPNTARSQVYRSRLVLGNPSPPELVPGLPLGVDAPILTPDQRTIYFKERGPDLDGHIYAAHRANVAEPFGFPHRIDELYVANVDDLPSWVSADQCELYFDRTDPNGHSGIYVASRVTPNERPSSP